MMRILLATDGSDYSEAAVDEIANRPFPADTEVRVISVFELPAFPIAVPWAGVDLDLDEAQKAAHAAASAAVEKAAAKLADGAEGRKLKVTTAVLAGSPKSAVLEEAEAFDADLIVVGSHGRGGLERFLLGSVSQAVAAHANCSVEIVRRRKGGASER
jgi:nucleotide-binding universal stress UspA family protein